MIKHSKKKCIGKGIALGKGCNQETYIYGYGLCYYCYKRFKRDINKPIIKKNKKPTGEKKLFEEIWNERSHYSYISEFNLKAFYNSIFALNIFAHVLSKNKYPKLRLNKNNIVLLTPREHYIYDKGTQQDRIDYAKEVKDKGGFCNWEKLDNLKEKNKGL